MALETILEKLIAAVEANTAAVKELAIGGGGGAPAAAVTKPAATAGKPAKPVAAVASSSIDFETLKAAGVKVMDQLGKPFAKKLIQEVTGADALPGVKKEKYPALIKAFEKALEDAANGGEDEAAEDDEEL